MKSTWLSSWGIFLSLVRCGVVRTLWWLEGRETPTRTGWVRWTLPWDNYRKGGNISSHDFTLLPSATKQPRCVVWGSSGKDGSQWVNTATRDQQPEQQRMHCGCKDCRPPASHIISRDVWLTPSCLTHSDSFSDSLLLSSVFAPLTSARVAETHFLTKQRIVADSPECYIPEGEMNIFWLSDRMANIYTHKLKIKINKSTNYVKVNTQQEARERKSC